MSIFILNKRKLICILVGFFLFIGVLTLALNSLSKYFYEGKDKGSESSHMEAVSMPDTAETEKGSNKTVSTEKKLPIYSVETPDKLVALTFNCAWGNEDIPDLLRLLEEHDVKATFFFVGEWAESFPESVRDIFEAGHSIGNHSQGHPDMTKLGSSAIKEDIQACNEVIEKITGEKPLYFRAPSGAYDNKTIAAAENLSMLSIQWDVDSIDWRDPSSKEIENRVVSRVKNGSIVLFHSGKKNTFQALPTVISELKKAGFSLVKLDELVLKENFYIDSTGRQHKSS